MPVCRQVAILWRNDHESSVLRSLLPAYLCCQIEGGLVNTRIAPRSAQSRVFPSVCCLLVLLSGWAYSTMRSACPPPRLHGTPRRVDEALPWRRTEPAPTATPDSGTRSSLGSLVLPAVRKRGSRGTV